MARDLLFEIGCEEIPAAMMDAALEALGAAAARRLEEARLEHGAIDTLGTPRRLTLTVADVADAQESLEERVLGPSVAVAFDAEGQPTKAAQGFARSRGVAVDELARFDTEKGPYLGLVVHTPGRAAADVLAATLPAVVGDLGFAKMMRWGEQRFRFVRPIRWLLALLGDEPIACAIAGVRSGASTFGHRSVGRAPIPVDCSAHYERVLEQARVLVSPAARRRRIEQGLAAAAEQAGVAVVEDEALLAHVVHLCEYPTVLAGTFPEEYLALPAEVLVTTLRHHQNAFSARDRSGAAANRFFAVANVDDPRGTVRTGNERVVRARLADARFFWQEDLSRTLAGRRDELDLIQFHEVLGTMADKTRRLVHLAGALAAQVDAGTAAAARRAAELAKLDLATAMVGEFPELQGVIGGLVAREEGEPDAVWQAIYDQYLPRAVGDPVPRGRAGVLLALADRVDSLVGLFGTGHVPSGSRDPFALRRAAQGVVTLLVEARLHLPFSAMVASARAAYAAGGVPLEEGEWTTRLAEFFAGRARFVLQERGHRPDTVASVLAVAGDDVHDAALRAAGVEEVRGEDDFLAVAAAHKRIKNILDDATDGRWREELLRDDAERRLAERVRQVEADVDARAGTRDYAGALRVIAGLRPEVDRFFDTVRVNVDEPELRANRRALLSRASALLQRVADFAQISVEGTSS